MATAGPALVGEAISIASAAVDELEALVREHASLVYRVAYAVLRNRPAAEDAAQETFVRVLRHRQQLPQVRDQRAWLARIAWRVALDRRRRAPEMPLDETAEAARRLLEPLCGRRAAPGAGRAAAGRAARAAGAAAGVGVGLATSGRGGGRSEERRVGEGVDLGGRRIIKKKKKM